MGALRTLVVAAAVCSLPCAASADSAKAWAAAKANLPSDTTVLIGLGVPQLIKSQMVKMVIPMLLSKKPEVKDSLDKLQRICGIDPWKAIDGVVVGADKGIDEGAMFLSVNGVDQAKLTSCIEDLVADAAPRPAAVEKGGEKSPPPPKVTMTKQGAVTELAIAGKPVAYFSWVGKDVLVLPLKIGDKAQLEKWTGKKGVAKSAVGKYVAKVNTGDALWSVSAVEQDLEGTKMKTGYGSLGVGGGNLVVDLHVVMDSPVSAKATADKAAKGLTDLAASPGGAAYKALAAKILITSAADEVTVKATMAESELMKLAGGLMGGGI